MKVEVIGKMPKVKGVSHKIGEVIDLDRKFVRAFIAAGMVREYTPPRPDIPASPSTPLSVVTEPVSDVPASDVEKTEEQAAPFASEAQPEGATQDESAKDEESSETPAPAATPRRRYSRRDMKSE